jgi:hypothetical protein
MTTSRRQFLRLAAAGGAAGTLGFTGHAQDPLTPPGTETGAEYINNETQAAIDNGLRILSRLQFDGAFTDRNSGASVGITSLAALALMAGGHQPGRGRYGLNVSRAVDYVLGTAAGAVPGFLASDGGFGRSGQHAWYGHGFGCLFLAEVCGMIPDPAKQKKVRNVLEQAAAYSVKSQNRDGGWRYEANPQMADVSVTVAHMMALRAAKNAGVVVRKTVIDKGVEYIRGCKSHDGGYSYMKGGGPSAFARSAAAVVGLYSAGIYEGPEITSGLRYIQSYLPGRQYSTRDIPPGHYYYGQYYAGLAMWTAGGDHWPTWFPAIRDELLARSRQGNGRWLDMQFGEAYATAMALIVLQLPNNYLPILQK